MSFVARWIATAVACAVAIFVLPGITAVGGGSSFVAIAAFSLVLSLINMTIKPILQLVGAPISILTLGLFYLIINAVLLGLAASISVSLFGAGVVIHSFIDAILGSIVISLVSGIVNGVVSK